MRAVMSKTTLGLTRTRGILAVMAWVLVAGTACSSGEGTEQDDTVKIAQEKCLTFVDAYCAKYADCAQSGADGVADCKSQMNQAVDCSAVVGVKSGYDLCLQQVADATCPVTELPASCKGVLLVETTSTGPFQETCDEPSCL